jgi:hypothetical protein
MCLRAEAIKLSAGTTLPVYLSFTYGLFTEAISSSEYVTSNGRFINQWLIGFEVLAWQLYAWRDEQTSFEPDCIRIYSRSITTWDTLLEFCYVTYVKRVPRLELLIRYLCTNSFCIIYGSFIPNQLLRFLLWVRNSGFASDIRPGIIKQPAASGPKSKIPGFIFFID